MSDSIERTTSRQSHPVDANRTLGDFVGLAVRGFCMGIADVIPGISGGTIAFMMGIYEDLIKAIKSFDTRFVRLVLTGRFAEAFAGAAWRFLGAVVFGIGCAILTFSGVVTWLLEHQPVFVNAFFFGLILVTVPIVGREIRKWEPGSVILLAATSVGTFFLVQMVPVHTPESAGFIFLSGALAICAMILPGISGAFILLILGKYEFIMNAVHQRDIAVVFIFCSGILVGILSFVRVLEWTFARHHDRTLAVLTGFVAGSLAKIWPWKQVLETVTVGHGKVIPIREANVLPAAWDGQVAIAAALFAAGCVTAFLLHALPQKHLK